MNAQTILDIASKEVLTISEEQSIKNAIERMYEYNHRDIVVLSNRHKKFGLLSSMELIKMKKEGVDFGEKISSVLYPTINTVNKDNLLNDVINNVNYQNYPMCVVDDENNLMGFVSYYDIISSVDPSLMLERRQIGEFVMGTRLKKASQHEALHTVINMMNESMYDCVILSDEANKPTGIITTKDVIRFFNEHVDLDKEAKEFMISPLLTVSYKTSIKESLDFIQDKHFKRLIITDDSGDAIGQITQEEILAKIYSRWADIMHTQQDQLEKANKTLNETASLYKMKCITDRLTGIYNRERLEVELSGEIHRVNRYKADAFSVVFFDIDNFKKINDTYGHPVGDKVIKRVVDLMKESLRKTDIFARWGGEEFVIIMSHTPLDKAHYAAEKLRQLVENEKIDGVGNVTCSFGVTEFLEGDDLKSIIMRADHAMYKAKREGRNKVVVQNESIC